MEEVKFSQFADDTLYIENLKDSKNTNKQKTIRTNKKISKFQDIKSLYKNQMHFYIIMTYMKEKLRKQSQ